MNVAELIKELEKYPLDKTCILKVTDEDGNEISDILSRVYCDDKYEVTLT